MIRRVILGLSGVLLVLLGALGGRRLERRDASSVASASASAGHSGSEHGVHFAQDWSALPANDLTIAGLFLTARAHGVGVALDSLEALVRTDSALRALGDGNLHHVVHTMGRFAIQQSGNDPRVFGACRPSFRSGCYHGVMEGYFAAGAPADSASLAALCNSLVADGAVPRTRIECAHGMGHGLAARGAHDPSNALPQCDALGTPRMRRACYDGVFMEAVNFATSGQPAPSSMPSTMPSSPSAGAGSDEHAMHMATTSTPARPTYDAVRVICDGRAARYQAACWYYQPILFLLDAKGDVERALARCTSAPAAAQSACAFGIGKQAMDDASEQRVASACRAVSAVLASGCRAGVVQYHIDLRWTADAAAAFCRSLPAGERTECFTTLGIAIEPLYPDDDAAARACDALAGALSPACQSGVRGAAHADARGTAAGG